MMPGESMARQDQSERRYPPVNHRLYSVLVGAIRLLVRLLTRLRVEGLENIPRQGPMIVVSNHLHHLDVPIMGTALPFHAFALAAEKYQKHLFFGTILRMASAIYIQRGEVDRQALRQASNVLEDGLVLAIAVEGTRSRSGALSEGKMGAAYLAARVDVPIVPVVTWGTENIIPAWFRLRRAEVTVRFGQPLRFPAGRARTAELEARTDEIMATLASLLPEAYRGVYSDHPLVQQKLAASLAGSASTSEHR